MSVKRERVNVIMSEAMGLERNLLCITSALDMLRKVDGSVEVDVCIPRLQRACAKLYQEIADLFDRYAGEEVEE